jgi:hypothetical protein
MNQNLNEKARQVIATARQEALSFNHSYIGTEHLLLALMRAEFRETAGVLITFGADASHVRKQVVQLVHRGPTAITAREVPLTPRARHALEIATEEARDANQKEVDPAHLLLGLMREQEGVAGKVLLGLGLNLNEVREAVLKIRHTQMKIVERAVRPVPASAARKRKMREELLAHLTAIYEKEQARSHNPSAAMQEAARRFGEPAALARELASALPLAERANYYINRNLAWRAPESAARYTFRLATQVTLFVAILFCSFAAGVFIRGGWNLRELTAFRPMIALVPFIFVGTFLLGLLYFKLRDAMCGAAWAPKSVRLAVLYDVLIALVAFGTCVGFSAVATSDPTRVFQTIYSSIAASLAAAIAFPLLARINGPAEISDTVWACLKLDDLATELA